jgi:pectinesterase
MDPRRVRRERLLVMAVAFAAASCAAPEPGTPGGGAGGGSPGAGGATGAGAGGSTGGGGSGAGTGGSSGSAGMSGSGGMVGSGGASGAGGTRPGAGGASGTGGAGTTGSGGAPGAGGATGAGGAPGAGGATAMCTPIASTATRPQLSSADAANFTIAKYLAGSDSWDPTAGLGSASSFKPDFTVAADGSGTHTTVQAALTAAASGSARRYVLVKPGTYRETVSISGSTPITIYGADTDATKVVIVNNASAGSAGGTAQSSTFTTKMAGFQIMNLTISNDFATPMTGSNLQAVALYTTGDKVVLQNVRLHGFQDTLFIDITGNGTSRVYIKSSFIEGDTDFIFGGATAVLDGCTINYLSSRKGTGSGEHLAPSTRVANNYGFLVIGANFTADATAPANKIYLGRSWDEGGPTPTPNGQAVVRESTLGNHIRKVDPWAAAATSMRAFSATGNRFDEYCNSGPGS